MATTHAAVGLLVAAPLVVLAPELATVGAIAGLVGGLFPDLDLVVGTHRRTFHYPEGYPAAAVLAVGGATLAPGPVTVALAVGLAAATAHVACDFIGGSTEPHPWEAMTNRGVYSHRQGRWLAPRRWVRYDGAPADLLLTVGLGAAAAVWYGPPVDVLAAVGTAVGLGYAAVRRRIPQLSDRISLPFPSGARVVPAVVRVTAALFIRLFRR
jgi:hypothetical protein